MDRKREEQILNAGMKAARGQLSCRPQRGEYLRDYDRLYSWLEDKLFTLYGAIYSKKTKRIFDAAGEIIIIASEVAEFASSEIRYEELASYGEFIKGDEGDEVPDNQHRSVFPNRR